MPAGTEGFPGAMEDKTVIDMTLSSRRLDRKRIDGTRHGGEVQGVPVAPAFAHQATVDYSGRVLAGTEGFDEARNDQIFIR